MHKSFSTQITSVLSDLCGAALPIKLYFFSENLHLQLELLFGVQS